MQGSVLPGTELFRNIRGSKLVGTLNVETVLTWSRRPKFLVSLPYSFRTALLWSRFLFLTSSRENTGCATSITNQHLFEQRACHAYAKIRGTFSVRICRRALCYVGVPLCSSTCRRCSGARTCARIGWDDRKARKKLLWVVFVSACSFICKW